MEKKRSKCAYDFLAKSNFSIKLIGKGLILYKKKIKNEIMQLKIKLENDRSQRKY